MPDDTLTINQINKNSYNHKLATTQLIFERNSKKTFLKNDFTYQYKIFEENGTISNLALDQYLNYPLHAFSNKFNWYFPLGKQIISWFTTFDYHKTKQELEIVPGQYTDLLNNGLPYVKMKQFLDYDVFSGYTGSGFIKKINRFTLTNNYKIKYKRALLNTQLGIYNPDYVKLDTDYQNDMIFSDVNLIGDIDLSYAKDTFRAMLMMPLSYRMISVEDLTKKQKDRLNDFVLDYDLTTIYNINNWKLVLSSSKSTSFNDIRQSYYGYVLQSYQMLKKYDASILKKEKKSQRASIHYKNILEGFSGMIQWSYDETQRNLMYRYQYLTRALIILQATKKENTAYRTGFKIQLSKYFTSIKTSGKFLFLYNSANSPVIINDIYKRIYSHDFDLMSQISFPLSKHFSLYFTYRQTQYHSRYSDISKQYFTNDIYIYPFAKKNHRIKLSNDYYWFSNDAYINDKWFMNISYHYKTKAKPFEYYIKLNNITNVDAYVDYYNFDYITQKTVYTLRPFQVLLGFNFSF